MFSRRPKLSVLPLNEGLNTFNKSSTEPSESKANILSDFKGLILTKPHQPKEREKERQAETVWQTD